MTFKQKDINFKSVSYDITENGVQIVDRSLLKKTETFQKFEDIGSKITKSSAVKLVWLIASLVPAALGIWVFMRRLQGHKVGNNAEYFYLFFFLVFTGIFIATRKRSILLVTEDYDNGIEFFDIRKDKLRVEAFIAEILKRRNEYLVKKYTDLDEALPYEQQYDNLVWLHNINVITKEQLKNKVKELDNLNIHGKRGGDRARIQGFGNVSE